MATVSQTAQYLKQQFLRGQGVVTQEPGAYPQHVVQKLGGPSQHKGYDIAVPVGTQLNTQGLQFQGVQQDRTGYGTRAAYKDPNSGQTYIFSHLSKVEKTPQGVVAYTGGIPGRDGRSTGPHVDIEIGNASSGFGQMLQNVVKSIQSGSPSQARRKINPQELLQKAKSQFGRKLVGVASSADKLQEAQRKYGGRIVKVRL